MERKRCDFACAAQPPHGSMRGSMGEEKDDSSQLIDWGGDLLAGLAAAQMAIAHPGLAGLYEGAMIGSTLALSFRNIVPLFFGRAMARREQERVGTVSVLTAIAIRKRLGDHERLPGGRRLSAARHRPLRGRFDSLGRPP